MSPMNRIPALALSATLGLALLGACSTAPAQTDPTPATPAVVATAPATQAPEPAPVETEAPVEAPVDEPTVEAAPVRVGTDTPGKPPAYEAEFLAGGRKGSMDRAEASGKYLVYVAGDASGWRWKIFGPNAYGGFRVLAQAGLAGGPGETVRAEPYASRQEALDAPKVLHGRTLDRAEYLLASE